MVVLRLFVEANTATRRTTLRYVSYVHTYVRIRASVCAYMSTKNHVESTVPHEAGKRG